VTRRRLATTLETDRLLRGLLLFALTFLCAKYGHFQERDGLRGRLDLYCADSLYLTAPVTNSRSAIPRAAATDLARRKRVSEISGVVFTSHCPIFMGTRESTYCCAQSGPATRRSGLLPANQRLRQVLRKVHEGSQRSPHAKYRIPVQRRLPVGVPACIRRFQLRFPTRRLQRVLLPLSYSMTISRLPDATRSQPTVQIYRSGILKRGSPHCSKAAPVFASHEHQLL
jgi:hypothetical protein